MEKPSGESNDDISRKNPLEAMRGAALRPIGFEWVCARLIEKGEIK